MEYTEAAQVVSASLAAGGDDLAAAGAMSLALEAWRHLAGTDRAWDRFALELLDIHSRLYQDQCVAVEAEPPQDDGPQIRAAVTALVEQLARHHERHALDDVDLAQRLDHDACAQQLRRAAAALT